MQLRQISTFVRVHLKKLRNHIHIDREDFRILKHRICMALFKMNQPTLLALILIVAQLTVVVPHKVDKVEADDPFTLNLYLHNTIEGDNESLIISAAPDGNLSRPQFGRLVALSNILRDGLEPDSLRIGTQVGIVAVGKDLLDDYISYVYHLNDDSGYNGSTIVGQGHIDYRNGNENRTFLVLGGTGKFFGVSGTEFGTGEPLAIYGYTYVYLHTLTLYGYKGT
ncbi:hypothetical protein R1sor_024969 [Riccia sorocarpa]|uniref:Dirigent protein n=1 Tax=Riccia sorocarpa TaxID=122646 RepID=A0ABD3G8K5_9MARC